MMADSKPVNLPYRFPREILTYLANDLTQCTFCFSSSHCVEKGLAGALLNNVNPTVIIDAPSKSEHEVKGTQKLAAEAFGHLAVPLLLPSTTSEDDDDGALSNTSGDAVAVVMFTSGSTGKPKAVPLTHSGLLWSCRQKLIAHGGKNAVRHGTLAFLPCSHVMGFTNNFLFNLAVARVPFFVHQMGETQPLCLPVLIDAVKVLQPSIVDTIPSFLEGLSVLLSRGDHAPDLVQSFAKCERVLYGGCALSTAAIETLSRCRIKVASQYGQTELGGMILIGEPHLSADSGNMGEMRAVPGCTWREAADGEFIIIDCEAAFYDYVKDGVFPTKRRSNEHLTGDLFSFRRVVDNGHEETWLLHRCRKDDLIVHSTGEMTNPLPIEDIITSIMGEAIKKVCVVGQRRAYPVLMLERDSRWKGNFERALSAALAKANSSSPAYSLLRRERVLILPEGSMPTSGKGNVIRSELERKNGATLDVLDAKLNGPRRSGTPAGEGGGDEDEDEDDPRYNEQPIDSMQIVRRQNSKLGAKESAFTFVCALCMFSVLQAHSLWPRLKFWSDPSVLHCGWLGRSVLLANMHKGLELLCMPGFVTIAGIRDHERKGHFVKRAQFLLKSAARLVLLYVVLHYLSTVVADFYTATGTACTGVSMQKVLWFLLFLSACRFILGTMLIMQIRWLHTAIAVVALHFWLRGRINAEFNEGIKSLLVESKFLNYSIFYFIVSPALSRLGIPTEQSGAWRSKRASYLVALILSMLGLPAVFPEWFQESSQVLSEIHDRPIVGPGMDISLLKTHLAQLCTACVLLVLCLEAVPRRTGSFSQTLGNGTLSAFILHWWTRPVWLRCIVLIIRQVAPKLQHCDYENDVDPGLASIVVAIVHTSLLLLVQWSLSAWFTWDIGYGCKQNCGGMMGTWKQSCLACIHRGRPVAKGVLAIGLYLLLYDYVKVKSPSSDELYAGNRCAAVIRIPAAPAPPQAAVSSKDTKKHKTATAFSAPTRSNVATVHKNTKISTNSKSGGLCMFVGNQSMMEQKYCSHLRGELQQPSNLGASLLPHLVPCLNREYVCDYNWGFYMPSAPWLTALGNESAPQSQHLRTVAKSLSACPRSTRTCTLFQLREFMRQYKAECSVMVVLSPDFLLDPTHNLALHHHPQVVRFLGSAKLVFTLSRDFFSTDPQVDGAPRGKTRDPRKMFFLIRNSFESDSLLNDWQILSPSAMATKWATYVSMIGHPSDTYGRMASSSSIAPSNHFQDAIVSGQKKWSSDARSHVCHPHGSSLSTQRGQRRRRRPAEGAQNRAQALGQTGG